MSDDRINHLSKRFQKHSAGRPPTATQKSRERKSFYIDAELVKSIDETYRKVQHDLYPQKVSKSSFLESLIQFGLDNLAEVTAQLPNEDTDE